jgi:hypothetical protein
MLHIMPVQQVTEPPHAWPSCEHVPLAVMQVPTASPGAIEHARPWQQSACAVHAAPAVLHESAQRGTPFPSGMHGAALQQSADDPQVAPVDAQAVATWQRGTPSGSSTHIPEVPAPAQQSLRRLSAQASPATWQVSPSGTQPVGLRHRPTGSLAWALAQVTLPAPGSPLPRLEPQQSLSFLHSSPSMRHPLVGWQTDLPAVPYGAHTPVQHWPQALHSSPSIPAVHDTPGAGTVQVPSGPAPLCAQIPPQQLSSFMHASPVWVQYDAFAQRLPGPQ